MFPLVARTLINLLLAKSSRPSLSNHLLPLRSLHKTPEKPNQDQQSLTLSYLINSCGLSPQSALSAAKKIDIRSTENADSFIKGLKCYYFGDTHIAKLITMSPNLLLYRFDKTIKPKLDFFLNIVGFSAAQTADFVSSDPYLIKHSLEKRLKTNFGLLRCVVGENTQQIATAIRRNHRLLEDNLEVNFLPNVRILQHCQVPAPNIAKFVVLYPRIVMQPTKQFETTVKSIKQLGFNVMSMRFVYGVTAMSGLNPSTWERKVCFYKSLGWSESEVISAFTKYPFCMLISEVKIRRVMDFYVKMMEWGPSFLSGKPVLLSYSLVKRIIPRCSVMKVLVSKGLVAGSTKVTFLVMGEKEFLNKFVIKYQVEVPEVLQAYSGLTVGL